MDPISVSLCNDRLETDDGYMAWGEESFLSKLGLIALVKGIFDLRNISPEEIPLDVWENEEIDRSLLPEKLVSEVIAYDPSDRQKSRFVSMRVGSREPVFVWLERNPTYADYVTAIEEIEHGA